MRIIELEPTGIRYDFKESISRNFGEMGHEVIFYETKPQTEDEKIQRAKYADVLIVSNLPLNNAVLSNCEKLKMISVAFAGVDHIDMDFCHHNNIVVSNAADYSKKSVAELTIGMILSLYRNIVWGDAVTRRNGDRNNFLGTELFGKTIGIIGLGRIGQQVARYGKTFGCEIIAFNRTPKNIEGVEMMPFNEVIQKSDIISIHTPLNEETRGMISKEEFELMKNSAILVNTGRGPIVNYLDLAKALTAKAIAGAAVDVYEKEPPIESDHPLLSAPNTLLLPHLGFATEEAIEKRSKIIVENITKWLNGTPQNVM